MKREKKEKDPVILLLDGIILLLFFVLLVTAGTAAFYRKMADKRSFTQDPGMISFELQKGDYAGLIEGKYFNEFNNETESVSYHALADYVEAAFLYRIYDTKGDAERADAQRLLMEESRAAMGELSIFADRADEMLGTGGT
ncbi:MAG: hypothetical protein IKO80_05075 [Lachnospiraceae bacterium]|nr:hypothetical protein [Lachnospiraceae bacterium]